MEKNNTKFPVGRVVATRMVANDMEQDNRFADFVMWSFYKHSIGEWGTVCEEDAQANEDALKEGNRVMSAYDYLGKKLWVITEGDRSVTTALYPEEY